MSIIPADTTDCTWHRNMTLWFCRRVFSSNIARLLHKVSEQFANTSIAGVPTKAAVSDQIGNGRMRGRFWPFPVLAMASMKLLLHHRYYPSELEMVLGSKSR